MHRTDAYYPSQKGIASTPEASRRVLPEEKMLSYVKISSLRYFIFLSSIYASQMIWFSLICSQTKY